MFHKKTVRGMSEKYVSTMSNHQGVIHNTKLYKSFLYLPYLVIFYFHIKKYSIRWVVLFTFKS
jgi:hypothetical protein